MAPPCWIALPGGGPLLDRRSTVLACSLLAIPAMRFITLQRWRGCSSPAPAYYMSTTWPALCEAFFQEAPTRRYWFGPKAAWLTLCCQNARLLASLRATPSTQASCREQGQGGAPKLIPNPNSSLTPNSISTQAQLSCRGVSSVDTHKAQGCRSLHCNAEGAPRGQNSPMCRFVATIIF